MKTGITGGIGSGKSYVCARLAARGISVYDCDSAAKRLMRTSPAIMEALSRLIGPDTYTDGRLNKARVAEFLLASETNAKAIDGIVHPAVADDFNRSGAEWMECAILYESGFNNLVDFVVAVTAEAKAREWLSRQMPQDEVERLADFVIVNDGQSDIDKQIDQLINKLK